MFETQRMHCTTWTAPGSMDESWRSSMQKETEKVHYALRVYLPLYYKPTTMTLCVWYV